MLLRFNPLCFEFRGDALRKVVSSYQLAKYFEYRSYVDGQQFGEDSST